MISHRRRMAHPAGYLNIAQPVYQATKFTPFGERRPKSSAAILQVSDRPGKELERMARIWEESYSWLRLRCKTASFFGFRGLAVPQPRSSSIRAGWGGGRRASAVTDRHIDVSKLRPLCLPLVRLNEKCRLTERVPFGTDTPPRHISYRHSSINTLLL
jgi:hypothetical protein